ncbi:MAG: transporter, partial [Chthoniobacteraceae bacterium]|nr:transporter [Chthoniobacteraceae bacterium]
MFTGTNQWSLGVNWLDLSAPLTGDPTADLTFGGTTSYTANNDFAGFLLNTLTLNATVAESITGNALDFRADDTPAAITQSGAGSFTIGNDILLTAPLTLNGTSVLPSSAVTLNGLISGGSGMTFNGGYWQLGNLANNFSGATTINTGAYLELIPSGASPQSVSLTTGTGLLGSSVLTINGGTLKLTSKTTGNINVGRAVTFSTNGGVLDITNGSGTAGTAGGNITGGDVNITSNAGTGNVAVVRFNGGQLGLSDNTAVSSNLNTGGNTLRFNSINGTGAIRVEVTNGALTRAGNGGGGTITIANPWTYRGVTGGDPTSGITGAPATDGKISSAISLNTGRVAVDNANVINYTGGLVFEDAVLVSLTGASRALDGNITIAGTASGHPGYVSFSGRATGTAINTTLNAPGGSAAGQNPIYIGQNSNDTFTVQDGGVAVFDLRVRTDQPSNNAVLLNAQAVLNPGAQLRLYQSISANSRFTSPGGAPNPGATSYTANDIIQGNIVGQGNTAKESVLEIYLPPAVDLSTNQILGGVDFQASSNIVINGSGFGGLRVSALARPNTLFAGATPDPVSNDIKLNNYLTATRLAALSGTGGYLSPAAAGATFNFPSGGEWANAQPVGLKVVHSNTTGPDLSLSAVTAFNHNVVVDAGATLDTGVTPFTFGSTQAVTLSGTGTVSGSGGIIIAAGSTLAPGLGFGTLNVGNITLNGTYQYEAANTPASDLLGVAGNLTLGASSVLNFPAGDTFTLSTDYTIATYTGTLTGTFGIVPTLPAGFSLSYGTLANSSIKLISTSPTDTWNGTVNGKWDTTTANWKTAALYTNGHRALFDDTAAGTKSVVITGGDVTPSRVTVDTAGNYTITGTAGNAIIGTAMLIKNGAGTLVISGPHTFSGGVSINTGTLKLGASDSLPDGGPVVVAAGSSLDTQGFSDAVASLDVDGAVNGAGTLTVGSLVLGSGAILS